MVRSPSLPCSSLLRSEFSSHVHNRETELSHLISVARFLIPIIRDSRVLPRYSSLLHADFSSFRQGSLSHSSHSGEVVVDRFLAIFLTSNFSAFDSMRLAELQKTQNECLLYVPRTDPLSVCPSKPSGSKDADIFHTA